MSKRAGDVLSADVTSKKMRQIELALIGTDISVLAQFVHLVEEDEDSAHLLDDALKSPTVMSILHFLDIGGSRKKSELLAIFQTLHFLILHGTVSSGNSEFHTIARDLAEGVLEDPRFSTVLCGLRSNQGAEMIKTTLRLLTSIVNVGVDLARGLLRSLNFESQDLVQCSKRRNKSDPQDARSCYLNLIGAFVFSENNLLIRELVDKKNAFFLVINESPQDKYADLMLVLHLLQKVVENGTVSKTLKLQLFSKVSLKKLLYLYTWRSDTDAPSFSADDPQSTSVRAKLHELFLLLTTSPRFGLVFCSRPRDTDHPSNGTILYALMCPPMEAAHTDPLRSELVVKSLVSCPDIIPHYLDHVAPLLQPRTSSKSWFNSMRLVHQIFEAIQTHLVDFIVTALNQWPEPQQVAQFVVNTCLLSPKLVQPLGNALNYADDADVVAESKALMKILRSNIMISLTWISTADPSLLKSCTPASLKDEIRVLVRERAPTTKWMKRFESIFDLQQFDANLLENQTYIEQKSTATETIKSVELPQLVEDFRLTLEDFRPLPPDLRKPLKQIFKHSQLKTTELSEKLSDALTNLSSRVDYCMNTYFHLPAVPHCLAIAFHLVRGTTLKLTKPKRLLNSLVAHPMFYKLFLSDPMSCTIGTPAEPPQDDITSKRHAAIFKDGVLDLLLELAKECPKACVNRIPSLWLLSSYTATLSVSDRKILRILYLLDRNSPSYVTPSCEPSSPPLVWGPTVRAHYQFPDQPPTTTQCVTRLPQPVLFHSPALNTLFGLLDEDALLQSAIHFPTNRMWLAQHSSDFPSGDSTTIDNKLLDPCFVLHTLDHYLSRYCALVSDPNAINKSSLDQFLRMFYSRHCLSFAVSALSSYSKHLRSLSRAVIATFRDLTFNWKPIRPVNVKNHHTKPLTQLFPERLQIVYVLDLLRNSLASGGGLALGGGSRRRWMFSCKFDTGGRLTRVHANFFVRCLQLLNNPGNHLYQPMWNCLLAKPAINLSQVPDFLRYFFSTHNMFRVERHFICRLCVDSMRDTADYLVMEVSRVFKHILAAYSSPSSDATFQLLVLRLLAAATRHSRIAHALVRFHALPLWLWRHALSPCSTSHLTQFHVILENMMRATSNMDTESPLASVLSLLIQEFRKLHGNQLPQSNLCADETMPPRTALPVVEDDG